MCWDTIPMMFLPLPTSFLRYRQVALILRRYPGEPRIRYNLQQVNVAHQELCSAWYTARRHWRTRHTSTWNPGGDTFNLNDITRPRPAPYILDSVSLVPRLAIQLTMSITAELNQQLHMQAQLHPITPLKAQAPLSRLLMQASSQATIDNLRHFSHTWSLARKHFRYLAHELPVYTPHSYTLRSINPFAKPTKRQS